jgi:hypothetical protein
MDDCACSPAWLARVSGATPAVFIAGGPGYGAGMLAKALLLLALLSKPYKDPQERFSINLPKGWSVGTSTTATATFTKSGRRGLANLAIQLLPVQSGTAVAKIVVSLTQALETQPGYKLLEQGAAKLGGKTAARRRYTVYVNGDPTMPKIAEDRVIIEGPTAYVVHVEAMTDVFGAYSKEFNKLWATFKPGKGLAPQVHGVALVGTWEKIGDEGLVFVLRGDGTFDLGGHTGIFGQEGSAIILRPDGGGPEKFDWSIEGEVLTLTSAALGEPIRYRRRK